MDLNKLMHINKSFCLQNIRYLSKLKADLIQIG